MIMVLLVAKLSKKLIGKISNYNVSISIIIVLFLLTKAAFPQNNSGTITGSIKHSAEAKIYVFLTNENTFGTPFTGIQKLVLEPEKRKGTINFRFENITYGKYCIRCFQDKNNNGKLDKGLFGPSEPWCLSWKSKKKFPFGFSDVEFELKSECKNINLGLSK